MPRPPANVKCPHCKLTFSFNKPTQQSFGVRLHCCNCRRYFKIWDAEFYNSAGENITEEIQDRLQRRREKYYEEKVNEGLEQAFNFLSKMDILQKRDLEETEKKIREELSIW